MSLASSNADPEPRQHLAEEVGPALERAAKVARERATAFGLPIVVEREGKLVYLDPKTDQPWPDQDAARAKLQEAPPAWRVERP